MGKTKTVEISGEPEEKDKKKKDKGKKEVKTPGLSGGERVVAVSGEPVPKKDEEEKDKKKKKKPTGKIKHPRGKKYKDARKKIDSQKTYDLDKAIKLIKETSYSSFDGTVELHLTVKKEGLSKTVTLPHKTGKEKKIEFADEDTIKKLKKDKIDFDILLATKDMMPKLVPFAKNLGPRGLMPNPKNGTLVESKKEAENFNPQKILLKTDKKVPVMHAAVGKVSMTKKKLKENIEAVIEGVAKRNIEKAHIAATMSPSVKLDLSS